MSPHVLARTAPVFGSVRTGRFHPTNQQGYIASCSCGWKGEAGTKSKVLEKFAEHKNAVG